MSSCGMTANLSKCRSTEERSQWETTFARRTNALLDSRHVAEVIQTADRQLRVDEKTGLRAQQFLQSIRDSNQPSADQHSTVRLWQDRKYFSVDDFKHTLGLQPRHDNRFPLLAKCIRDEAQLRALPYLPGALEWTSLLVQSKRWAPITSWLVHCAHMIHMNRVQPAIRPPTVPGDNRGRCAEGELASPVANGVGKLPTSVEHSLGLCRSVWLYEGPGDVQTDTHD